MSFFQNLFENEFRGNLVLGDRQYSLAFTIPANKNKDNWMVAWNNGPYDFSVSGIFTINYAFDVNFVNYSTLNIDVTGGTAAATTALEVVSLLNANATFSELWVAQVQQNVNSLKAVMVPGSMPNQTVLITRNPRRAKQTIRTYISNSGAENSLRFNKMAPVAELPAYFTRHTIANRLNYPDATGMLLGLSHNITSSTVANPTVVTSNGHGLATGQTITVYGSDTTPTINGSRVVTVVDANTFTIPVNVTDAGTAGWFLSADEGTALTTAPFWVSSAFSPTAAVASAMQADWSLLKGRGSGLFMFHKLTYDGSGRTTVDLEYPAGAVVGDFAKRTSYTYTGANTYPDQITEIPYTLASGDLVTPS